MEQYLTDYGTLARVVDPLLSQKYPNETPENLKKIREETICKLDDKIGAEIFDSLDEEQLKSLNRLFDDQEQDPAAFQNFFKNAGINLSEKISEIIESFSKEFLGGEND